MENFVYNFEYGKKKIIPACTHFPKNEGSWNPTDNLVDRYVDKMWITFEFLLLHTHKYTVI